MVPAMTSPASPEIHAPERPARRVRWPILVAGLAVLLAVGVTVLWLNRLPIARSFIADQLKARGVRASYDLVQVGGRTQRIEHLVLGDPARPSLVARSVEVDIGYSGIIPAVAAIRAEGVRLNGRVGADGAVSLGELDRFRSQAEDDTPFNLPDINLTVTDGRARMETPYGPIGLALNGQGNLRSGFRGDLAAVMRDVAVSGCATPLVTAALRIHVSNGAPRAQGPLAIGAFGCPGRDVSVAALGARLDVRANEDLASLSGQVGVKAQAIRAGKVVAAAPWADLRFAGPTEALAGTVELGAAHLRGGGMLSDAARLAGQWRAGGRPEFAGTLTGQNLAPADRAVLSSLPASLAGTPLSPLAARLAEALGRAGQNRFAATLAVQNSGGAKPVTMLRVTRLDWNAQSGARLALDRDSALAVRLPEASWAMQGGAQLSGGGLPEMSLSVTPAPGGGLKGQFTLQPYSAAGARLALAPAIFEPDGHGSTRLRTRLTLDGPLGGGVLRGLSAPVDLVFGVGGFRLNPGCTPVSIASLRIGAVTAGAQGLRLCALDGNGLVAMRGGRLTGGGQVAPLRLAARTSGSPALLKAARARWSLSRGDFELVDATFQSGPASAPIRFAGTVTGGPAAGGMGGTMSGLGGQLGSVPLVFREGMARWGYAGGVLKAAGTLGVIDAAAPDRFNPLVSRGVKLTFANGRIDATGSIALAAKGGPFAALTLRHDLGTGAGQTAFRLTDMRFSPRLQPEDVSRLALGVVANVTGAVEGDGLIRWSGDRVTSTGTFTTRNTDLAAAFGPVEGLSTTIHFTDLLNMVTAPSQIATVRGINAGVEVRDGRIAYALRAGQQVVVEGGEWPFSGGTLTMLPTVMDFSADKPRHLTFRVVGIDAGAFINTMELKNISATGTFDGVLPIVFDATGGKITGGVLVARQVGLPPLVLSHVSEMRVPCYPDRQGGMLSYVGEVSNENLGTYGRMAFDALKNLQYKCLTILMDGALDGEIVTQVAFNGVNRGELSSAPSSIAKNFIGLPFIFNIRIEAPFRGLMNNVQAYSDPTLAIRNAAKDQFTPVIENTLAVQPDDSKDRVQRGP